ncbi:MAG: NAD(P)H-hydrate dehydratase [Eubacteriales bacterium]|jgi:NAD(P)H-hydrate epimerase
MKADYLRLEDITGLLPMRPAESSKKTFGRVLAVCGSYGMSGAAYLCAKAAYRSGCGLVEILTVEENRVILQTSLPEAIVTCFSSASPDCNTIISAVSRADAVIIGCGLGKTPAAREVTEILLSAAGVPLVIDADALNIISEAPRLWELIHTPAIITPHPGEMSRLSGLDIDTILSDTARVAFDFADEHRVVCVLKTHNTVVTDGSRIYINTTGNSGMATGGSGDVLAGIIASLAAQQKGRQLLLETAALGVYLHGLAGDDAAAGLGEHSVMASDIIDFIPGAIKRIAGGR